MENLEKGKFYFIKLNHFGRDLSYEGKVIDIKGEEFFLKTDEDCRLSFKIKDLISVKEIEGKELDEEKVFVIRKKGPLKEIEKPKGL